MNAVVNVLMTEDLITRKQRKNDKEMKIYGNKLSAISTLLKYWCTGDGRPENGAFVAFDTSIQKSGKVVIPRFI